METVFQNEGGRPRAFSDAHIREFGSAMNVPDDACRRTKVNMMYVLAAFGTLHLRERTITKHRFRWLAECFGDSFKRKQILVAIGRIKNRVAARVIASEICKQKPTVRASEALIRRWHDRIKTLFVLRIVDDKPLDVRTQFRIAREVVRPK